MWSGALWCDALWCDALWCGVVWCGVVWCGVVWCGLVCSIISATFCVPVFGMNGCVNVYESRIFFDLY